MAGFDDIYAGAQHALQASAGSLAGLAALYGLLFHALVVRKLAVEEYMYTFLGSYFVAMASVFPICLSVLDMRQALTTASLLILSFNAGLYFSMATYRLFFHRLRKFPGPFGAKLSRFYVTLTSAKKVQYHEVIKKWHEKYGDFIRTGPRELAIVRRSAVNTIYGPQSECGKSTWYIQVSPDQKRCSIHMTRDFEAHKNRRKAWDRGFSVKAINTYAPRISSKVDLLLQQIKAHAAAGESLDASKWTMLLTFDMMGEVGFGKDFGGLKSGIEHPAIKGIHDHMTVLGIMATVPWLLNIAGKIPGATAGYAPFFSWCEEQVKTKYQDWASEKQPQDIISHLLKAYVEKDISATPTADSLHEDARAVVIAGSDTTATTLTHILFYLCKYPEVLKKLQTKLDVVMPNREWSFESVKSVSYVDDIINEALRLKPALLTGGYRTTPPHGIVVDGVHIPGNTNVFVPMQLIQTDSRYHPQADEFIPERFGERKGEWQTEKQPWIPFSIGPFSCPGKSLAIATLRIALSKIALHFDVSFAPGETGEEFDKGVMDTFTTTLLPLQVRFTPRV